MQPYPVRRRSPAPETGERTGQRFANLERHPKGLSRNNLYILEEPTIGLHMRDCERLIELLHRLVDQGHTVIVIEHNTDVIAEADYVVEMGPEGGDAGGEILYQGRVAGLHACDRSRTARYLPGAPAGVNQDAS
ncbi:MAG: hypothetical protein LR015_02130 [Verrucomicrobia bacterium]|nr:hypothetical protein [Verrucomicrobiota bacterium]